LAFVSEASGNVTAFLNNPNAMRIYLSTERPLFLANPNVTSLNEIPVGESAVQTGNFH
jgi:hypothetical protein